MAKVRSYALRHPLAILRQIAGLTQKELADLVGRSLRSIQAIEIGRLPLSEELAVRTSHETGASVQWLLTQDPRATPTMSLGGLPYTKAVFEHTRADLAAGKNPNLLEANLAQDQISLNISPLPLMRRLFDQINSLQHPNMDYWLVSILASVFAAAKAGQATLAIYRLTQFTKTLREEFGQKVDHEFIHEAASTFEAGLQRIKIAEFLLEKDKSTASSTPGKKEPLEKDVLRETQFGENLEGLDEETLWTYLNQVGDRLKARGIAAQQDYADLTTQMQQVLSASKSVKQKNRRSK